jgi:hypothetical protein
MDVPEWKDRRGWLESIPAYLAKLPPDGYPCWANTNVL